MDIQTFIQNFKEAFGENAELPLVFWYSDILEGTAEKINGCFFKGMKTVREGGTISLNAENIGCGGGKFYTGFTEMPERVPTFVSLKERYKQTPEMVIEFIRQLGVPMAEKKYLHIDKIRFTCRYFRLGCTNTEIRFFMGYSRCRSLLSDYRNCF